MPQSLIISFIFLGLLCFCDPCSVYATDFNSRSDYLLDVSSSQFLSSLTSTIEIVRDVSSILSQFGGSFGDFRLSNAISDCLELLDFSADELDWTLSASQNPNTKDNSTGDVNFDLRTWLSATLANQDTCTEGFDGTNSIVKGVIAGSLNQITSLVTELLTSVQPSPKSNSTGGKGGGGGGGHVPGDFPPWVNTDDRKSLQANGVAADVVVATDGSGDFTSVMDAVMVAPDHSKKRFVIYVKKGIYKENVEIKKKKTNLMMVGDGMDATIISSNHNYVDGWTTFRSATFAVSGGGFMARDITFENTAGPQKHQAVALRSDSDLSVFLRCGIKGYQDSLYTHTMRQFFRECKITGTVDFIFGDATVVFQNCQILAKQGLPNQKNTITAHGRKEPSQPTGFSFQFCNISADSDLISNTNTTQTYLGRPWKPYSRTIVMQSYMSNAIRPQGWLEWNGDLSLDTLYYAEYMNYGPGAGLGSRVKWPGYHALNDSSQAHTFTVAQFIEGNLWLPSTGVKYTSGLGV